MRMRGHTLKIVQVCLPNAGAADVIAVPQTQEELMSLKASALRQILDQHNILANDCFEKSDLVTKILEKIVNKA